jgi:hypothetical protein
MANVIVHRPGSAAKPTATPGANILALDAFVRSVTVNAQVGHMLLLGAGASISSNVPSAANCIWQWKRSIFLSNHPGVERSFDELSLGSVQQRIQVWLDSQPRFPAADAPEEYSFYVEHCYPVADDRRAFFQRHVQAARPSGGYRLAARLAQAGLLRSVWTTNFDGLMARANAGDPGRDRPGLHKPGDAAGSKRRIALCGVARGLPIRRPEEHRRRTSTA